MHIQKRVRDTEWEKPSKDGGRSVNPGQSGPLLLTRHRLPPSGPWRWGGQHGGEEKRSVQFHFV